MFSFTYEEYTGIEIHKEKHACRTHTKFVQKQNLDLYYIKILLQNESLKLILKQATYDVQN